MLDLAENGCIRMLPPKYFTSRLDLICLLKKGYFPCSGFSSLRKEVLRTETSPFCHSDVAAALLSEVKSPIQVKKTSAGMITSDGNFLVFSHLLLHRLSYHSHILYRVHSSLCPSHTAYAILETNSEFSYQQK